MRLKISTILNQKSFIPFNYNYALHSAIYGLIEKSSKEYSAYLHDQGFIDKKSNKRFKLFTFSKLLCSPCKIIQSGFKDVENISFFFSTPIEKSYEHLVLGVFADQHFFLNLAGKKIKFSITQVESTPPPDFKSQAHFKCLSPIAVSTVRDNSAGEPEKHYLDYMNPKEREHFILNIKNNLINKFQTFYKTEYKNHDCQFEFSFDTDYIVKKGGKISKLMHFKKIGNQTTKIKAFEAPFKICADPELVKIGYDCGFGNDNSAGLGCVGG